MGTCAGLIVFSSKDHPRLMIYQELSFTISDPTGCTRPSEIAFLVVKLTSLPHLFGSLLLYLGLKFSF